MTEPAEQRIASRQQWIRDRKREGVEGVYKATAIALPLPPSLHDALRVPRAARAVIVELSRCPGGPGSERVACDVAGLAARLEADGVTALSICPDEAWSGCSYHDILVAAQATSLPILCCDSVLDPLQITMARAHGAAAVVLRPALVPERDLRALMVHALDLGLDLVFEVRNARDLEAALATRRGGGDGNLARLVAVDGAPSGRFDLGVYERLAQGIPEHAVRVASSGVALDGHAAALEGLGYDAFVVRMDVLGPDPHDGLRAITGEKR